MEMLKSLHLCKILLMQRLFFTLLIISLMIVSGCSKNPVTGKRQLVFTSESGEQNMGASADPQIVAAYGLYQDAKLQTYINDRGNEMAKISHRPNLNYEFKIVDSPVVNAFAVPGGYVYFTRGIMAHFNNEAEFSGVLGHEIGHITARHSVIQQRNAILSQVGLVAGLIAVPELAQFAGQASQGVQLMMLKFGRDDESQSDELGVEYSTKIGYDAVEMADFFNTLSRKQAEAGVSLPEFLSTHPNPDNRKERVGQLAAEYKSKLGVTNAKVGRNSYLSMLEGLVYGEDPRQGFVQNNKFYHPELKFYFNIPANWKYQNSPQAFQMANAEGTAMMALTLAQGTDLVAAGNAFVQQNNLAVLRSNDRNINGNQALEIVAQQTQQNQSGQQVATLTLKITLIKYQGRIYNIYGVSRPGDFPAFESRFTSTMTSFKQLTDPNMLNKQPERVSIVEVKNNGSFKKALESYNMPANRHEELAILNGMYLTDQVQKGLKFKIVK